MPSVPLLARTWACPNCDAAARTVDAKTPMHRCRGTKGLMVPLVPEGVRAKHERVERGDYVGHESVQTDSDGRPAMSVVTTTDEGQSCTVYAPAAHISAKE